KERGIYRSPRNSQVMKVSDPLLSAWQRILRHRGSAPAVLDEQGTRLRSFRQVEERAQEIAVQLTEFRAGAVVGGQIGNHPDWPCLFLASLRRRLVIVPLDQSISDRDRSAALKICRATGLIENAAENNSAANPNSSLAITFIRHQTIGWGHRRPCLLK